MGELAVGHAVAPAWNTQGPSASQDQTATLPSLQENPAAREGEAKGRFDTNGCQTCKNRKYQDGSSDPGVSYKIPTHIRQGTEQSAVRSHEMEHVSRERAQAQRDHREMVSQTVVLHTGICPECGRAYISGGTTRTTTRNKSDEVAEILRTQAEQAQKTKAGVE